MKYWIRPEDLVLADLYAVAREKSAIFPSPLHTNQLKRDLTNPILIHIIITIDSKHFPLHTYHEGKQSLMIVDKPLSELEQYRPALTAEDDFEAFWQQTLAESEAQ